MASVGRNARGAMAVVGERVGCRQISGDTNPVATLGQDVFKLDDGGCATRCDPHENRCIFGGWGGQSIVVPEERREFDGGSFVGGRNVIFQIIAGAFVVRATGSEHIELINHAARGAPGNPPCFTQVGLGAGDVVQPIGFVSAHEGVRRVGLHGCVEPVGGNSPEARVDAVAGRGVAVGAIVKEFNAGVVPVQVGAIAGIIAGGAALVVARRIKASERVRPENHDAGKVVALAQREVELEQNFAAHSHASIATLRIVEQAVLRGRFVGVAVVAQRVGRRAKVVHHSHGRAVGVQVQYARSFGEVGQADGFVVVGAVDACAVLVVERCRRARRKGDRSRGPAVAADQRHERRGFQRGIAPLQRQQRTIEEESRRPGMGATDAHARVGVDLECHLNGLRDAAGGRFEAILRGARVVGGILNAAGLDHHKVGGDGRSQLQHNARRALHRGGAGHSAIHPPVGGVFGGDGLDGFVENHKDKRAAHGAHGGADIGRVDIAHEHVGNAVVVGVHRDIQIIHRGTDAVGVVAAGLVGDGVRRTPGTVGIVVMNARQQVQRCAARHSFASFHGAPASAFVEHGPRDARLKTLMRARGGIVHAGHVHRRTGGGAAVAGIEQRFQIVGGGCLGAVIIYANGVVVKPLAGEHVIEAEATGSIFPAVVIIFDEAGFYAGPIGGGGGAGAGTGIHIQQDNQLVVVGLPRLQGHIKIGGIPRDEQVGERTVDSPSGFALECATEVGGIVFNGSPVQGGGVCGCGIRRGGEQKQKSDTQQSFHSLPPVCVGTISDAGQQKKKNKSVSRVWGLGAVVRASEFWQAVRHTLRPFLTCPPVDPSLSVGVVLCTVDKARPFCSRPQ